MKGLQAPTTPDGRLPFWDQHLGSRNRLCRLTWSLTWMLLAQPSPVRLYAWRRLLVRLFGGTVGEGAHIYPAARIWAPWNLRIGARSCLANGCNCYNVAPVLIEDDVVVSQDAELCTATHDYNRAHFPLVAASIRIESRAWIASGAFVAPGVTVRRGAVVAARAVVTRNVEPWTVVAGNPARIVNHRVNLDA